MNISSDEIEDILYCSREGELDPIKEFLNLFKNEQKSALKSIIQESTGNTPLHMAAGNGHVNIVKLLLSIGGKSLTNQSNANGNTPLHWAALNGHIEVVKVLCEEGKADPFIKNNDNRDVFYNADNGLNEPVMTYLLEKYNLELEMDENASKEDSLVDDLVEEPAEI